MNTSTDMSSKTIKGPAGDLFIDDGGESGIPVLFIHSFGGSTRHWEKQLSHTREQRRAIAMDLRGHGRSAAPANNDYNVRTLAADISFISDNLKLDKIILVGHSMGGSAAIAYTGMHPDRVAGLFITGTPGKTAPEQSKAIIASLESSDYEKVMEDYMKKLLANASPATESLERQGMNRLSRATSVAIIKAVFNYDPLPDLERYRGPVMILSNTEEEQPGSLHKAFPAIPYRVVKGTSHWIQLDNPAAFNAILDEFLEKVDNDQKK